LPPIPKINKSLVKRKDLILVAFSDEEEEEEKIVKKTETHKSSDHFQDRNPHFQDRKWPL